MIDELAECQNTYADNLRRQPNRKWAALGQICSYPGKKRYSLKVWGEAASFLLSCPITFESCKQVEDSLKPFNPIVR